MPQPFVNWRAPLKEGVSTGEILKFVKRMNKIAWCAIVSKDACQTLTSSHSKEKKNLMLDVLKAVL